MRAFIQRFSVITGFSILGALLLLNAFITRRQVQVQVQNAVWLMHSQQVLYQLEQTESLLTEAETGQRGYLYTGDPKYLAPYNKARTEIDGQIDELTSLTADNPEQVQDVARLRILAEEKLGELARTIALDQAGKPDDARELVLSDRGIQAMDSIRVLIDSMRQEETRLDAARSAAYARSIRKTLLSIFLATAAAILGIAILACFILRERTLRERHARELRLREEWFRVTLTSIGDAVIATDSFGKVTFVNPVAETLTGNSLAWAKGRDITEVFPIINEKSRKRVDDPVKKVMEQGAIVGLANHTALVRKDGAEIPIEDSAAPIRDDRGELIGVVLVFRDVSADRRTEELLRRAEKLSAAARLSATVAHEINNPLAAVLNLIYITRKYSDSSPAAVESLLLAEQELERVAHIVRRTLGFYRESVIPEEIDVAALVESVLRLFSNKLAAKNISVKVSFEGCGPMQGFMGELRQAISNLISNAIDAVAVNGTITVSAQPIQSGDSEMIEIVVADDGLGIEAEHVDRIFEPFFTTKKEVGTGLGLWATKAIIERHGGCIRVSGKSAVEGGSGATFIIQLPRLQETPAFS
jgi:PAS domain S-box-containing protein